MFTGMSDIVVEVDETLNAAQQATLTVQLMAHEELPLALFDEQNPHILDIEYDPTITDSQQALAMVTNQGVHAHIIGGIFASESVVGNLDFCPVE
ncbi:MAG: hypothetical protein HQL54_00230 [Magnetococcales bacterium]|nr:hypothetical protein [Magnetococcales bacterium]